jgi:hypothetical protein
VTPTLFADHPFVRHHSGLDLCLQILVVGRLTAVCHQPAAVHP